MKREAKSRSHRRSLVSSYSERLGTRIVRHRADIAMTAARVQAEQASLAKSEFIAKMSHELRTPLSAILGFSEILKSGDEGQIEPDKIAEYAQFIHSSAQHLFTLVNGILEISKHQSGTEKPDLVEIEFNDIVQACFTDAQQMAKEKKLHLSCELGQLECTVMADRTRLKSAIEHILSNATKFCPSGGKVTMITDQPHPNTVTLKVRDTGIGMTPTEIESAFEVFWQADTGRDRQFEGAGLGLPIVKTMIELQGGDIQISSEPGAGTQITLSLPARAKTKQALNLSQHSTTQPEENAAMAG